ncbi:MAG TPA: carboxypeptidase-like regulatory domain-containing protein [Thermoanaerobaculia bacterium]|jgi:hypothetical protein
MPSAETAKRALTRRFLLGAVLALLLSIHLGAPRAARAAPAESPGAPAGTISGRLVPPRNEALARGPLEVHLQSPPGTPAARAIRAATRSCPVDEAGGFRCDLPAGTLDLRLRREGYVPLYRWAVPVSPGEEIRLGLLALARGASIAGRVMTTTGVPLLPSCRVALRPQTAAGPASPAERARLGALGAEAAVDARGFFQLAGVRPGTYVLTAREPRFMPASRIIVVEAARETELVEPLRLAPPLRLEVAVDPPLDPWQQPWRLALHPLAAGPDDDRPRETGGALSAEGVFRREDLAPGAYGMEVLDSRGESFLTESLDLDGDRALSRELPLLWVAGTVAVGERPIATELRFRRGGSRDGQVRLRSDEKGKFTGVLPREGRWWIEVVAVGKTVHGFEIRRAPGAREAKVEIRIPDTRVVGEVVDEAGSPVAEALVEVVGLLDPPDLESTTSGADGRFEIRGLPYGTLHAEAEVEAGDRHLASAPTPVSLDRGHEIASLRLTVFAETALAGRVSGPGGPVAGAFVLANPRTAELPFAASRDATTDPEGLFHLWLPAAAVDAQLVVMAPGLSLQVLRVPAPFTAPLAIAVEPAGGTLVLATDSGRAFPSPLDSGAGERLPLVVADGQPIALALLRQWAGMNGTAGGGAMSFPAMPAGDYAACLLTLREQIEAFLGIAAPRAGSCAHGYLSAGGELRLTLPAEKAPL